MFKLESFQVNFQLTSSFLLSGLHDLGLKSLRVFDFDLSRGGIFSFRLLYLFLKKILNRLTYNL